MTREDDIRTLLEQIAALAPAGYAMALHIRFTTPTYLFQTYPKAWIDHYSQNGMVMRDPTVAWGFENEGAIRWADLTDNDTFGIMAEAQKYGLLHGFTYATVKDKSRSVCSFSRSDRDFTPEEITQITGIVDGLQELTGALESLSQKTRDGLRALSIHFTHP